jgi:hypothetical protein
VTQLFEGKTSISSIVAGADILGKTVSRIIYRSYTNSRAAGEQPANKK